MNSTITKKKAKTEKRPAIERVVSLSQGDPAIDYVIAGRLEQPEYVEL